MTAVANNLSDTLVLARRSILRIVRAPDLLIGFTLQPVMFVVLFVYVFGGAIETPGFNDYTDFLIPGIIVQTMSFGGFATALGLAEDLQRGLIDRFRSLPMAAWSVLAGRTLADIATNLLALTIMIIVGLLTGFAFATTVGEFLLGVALLLCFGYAFTWVFAWFGLIASSPEASNAYGFMVIFPLSFISSCFVPIDTMPAALEAFAEVNPFTIVSDALRTLWLGTPGGDIALAFAWVLGISVVFAMIATRRFRRAVLR